MRKTLSILRAIAEPVTAAFLVAYLVPIAIGDGGLFPQAFATHAFLKYAIYVVLMTHLTITAMSLCFHRVHTHQGAKLHPVIDFAMQVWLWCVSSMAKADWVSVHIYHHAHSDQDKDPHSPVKRGLLHVLFMGVFDYTVAKSDPEVMKIKKRIPRTRWEAFIEKNVFAGPILMGATLMVLFGPFYGSILMFSTFLITPVFAVGGVNAIAHWFGYRNYETTDNSRNVGFLFPLNWMICGELDHNNHHAHPRSCSFRHRAYEFDIGFAYLTVLNKLGLAELKTVYRLGQAGRKAPPPPTPEEQLPVLPAVAAIGASQPVQSYTAANG